MESPPLDKTPAADLTAKQGTDDGGLRATEDAITFLSNIDAEELQRCVFEDSLVTLTEGGRDLGKFKVSVEFSRRGQQPCMLLRAQSQGAIDDSPCGTTVTAYLSVDLEVLEEDHREYVQLDGHILEKRCHMVQRDGQMLIDKVTTVGEVGSQVTVLHTPHFKFEYGASFFFSLRLDSLSDMDQSDAVNDCRVESFLCDQDVTEDSVSYPVSDLKGLLTEGSNLLLMRLMALKRNVPEHMMFVCLDQGLNLIHTVFSELALKQLEIGGETVEVFGVERSILAADAVATWQCYFLANGRLASRVQVGSPAIMRLLQLRPTPEKGVQKIPLVWEEDLQMRSNFLDRKTELKADHASYLRQNPEIGAIMSDFVQFLLLRKPEDVFQFAREYFLPFASPGPPEPSLTLPSL